MYLLDYTFLQHHDVSNRIKPVLKIPQDIKEIKKSNNKYAIALFIFCYIGFIFICKESFNYAFLAHVCRVNNVISVFVPCFIQRTGVVEHPEDYSYGDTRFYYKPEMFAVSSCRVSYGPWRIANALQLRNAIHHNAKVNEALQCSYSPVIC